MQMMEESPTRGMDMGHEQPQQSLNSIKPSGGFTFGASTTSSPFGQPSQPASSSFAFGANNQTKVETKSTISWSCGLWKLLLCMRRRSTSRTLLTKNFFRPLGRRWRVFLLLP